MVKVEPKVLSSTDVDPTKLKVTPTDAAPAEFLDISCHADPIEPVAKLNADPAKTTVTPAIDPDSQRYVFFVLQLDLTNCRGLSYLQCLTAIELYYMEMLPKCYFYLLLSPITV